MSIWICLLFLDHYSSFSQLVTYICVVENERVQSEDQKELGSGSLQSLNYREASYRQKGNRFYKVYVVNLSETCAPENPLQLIT